MVGLFFISPHIPLFRMRQTLARPLIHPEPHQQGSPHQLLDSKPQLQTSVAPRSSVTSRTRRSSSSPDGQPWQPATEDISYTVRIPDSCSQNPVRRLPSSQLLSSVFPSSDCMASKPPERRIQYTEDISCTVDESPAQMTVIASIPTFVPSGHCRLTV